MPKYLLKHLLIYFVVATPLIWGTIYIYNLRSPSTSSIISVTALALWLIGYPLFVLVRLCIHLTAFIKNVRQRIRTGELVTSSDYYYVIEYCAATAGGQAWIPKSLTKWALRKFLKKTIQEVIQKKFGNKLGLREPTLPSTSTPLEKAS